MNKDVKENLTKKIKSVFSKNGKKTAVEGAEPTFHTSKTYGGTIPYLPGKFREEYSKETNDIEEYKNTSKTQNKTHSKSNSNKKKNHKK